MKRILSVLLTLAICLTVALSMNITSLAAASVTDEKGTVLSISATPASVVTENEVTVSVTLTATADLQAAIQMGLTFDAAKLSFVSDNVADNVATVGNGTIGIMPDVSGKSYTYTAVFKAISAGTANVAVTKAQYFTDAEYDFTQFPSTSITVTAPAPTPDPTPTPDPEPTPTPDPKPDNPPASNKSSNANLGSLTLGSGKMEPEFKADVTSYNVTVRFEVQKLTISANAEDGKSTVEGIGTFDLEVGENKKFITVTAEDGTKKVYELNIKRLTSEETAELPPEEPQIELGPLDIEFYGSYLRVVQDTSSLPVPHGFTAATAMHNEIEVGVMLDNVKGEYILYYLTDLSGSNGDYYYKDEKDNFQRLNYISVNGRLYIIEQSFGNYTAPDGWEDCEYSLHTGKVKAFRADSNKMDGFYMFFCYVNGERGFYRYDSLQNTIQREPEFSLVPLKDQESKAQAVGIFERFSSMNFAGKTVVILLVAAVIFIIAIVALMIVKFIRSSGYPEDDDDELIPDKEEFLPIDDGIDEYTIDEDSELPPEN